jgi:uncharacterized protein YjbI with pentapeptide repeats
MLDDRKNFWIINDTMLQEVYTRGAYEISMGNANQIRILRQGAEAWNKWRIENPDEHIDLSEADLTGAKLSGANLNRAYFGDAKLDDVHLEGANLSEADFSRAQLGSANLQGADLSKASFSNTYLGHANLSESNLDKASLYNANLGQANLRAANLQNSNFAWANLNMADLSRADLQGANLFMAHLVQTNLEGSGCGVYGISAWGVKLKDSIQKDLVIANFGEPTIKIDNIEVAQFIYLLLHNEKIRDVIDTITSKVVLILGRFTDTRKPVLDAIREELRRRDYLPVLFDFEKPANRDIAETVSTLAHMARFIIADITDAKSIPAELELIVPQLLSVPVMPVILKSDYEYALFERIMRFNQVLEPYQYENQEALLASVGENVIKPAEEKGRESLIGLNFVIWICQ